MASITENQNMSPSQHETKFSKMKSDYGDNVKQFLQPHYYEYIVKKKNKNSQVEVKKVFDTRGNSNCEIRNKINKNNNNRSMLGTPKYFEDCKVLKDQKNNDNRPLMGKKTIVSALWGLNLLHRNAAKQTRKSSTYIK